MDYLVYVIWTDSDGRERTEYYVVQADGPDEAGVKARAVGEAITRREHFDSDKHGFEYEGRYASGYSGVVDCV